MAIIDRVSSMDDGYSAGDLSIYPEALDSKDTLYIATNNSSTILKQTLSYNGKSVIVEDASGFPPKGQIRISPIGGGAGESELIYYETIVGNTFRDLKRGFAGSTQTTWSARVNKVENSVFSDHHNCVKDSIINMEQNLGLIEDPVSTSLNGILESQELRFLTPRPIFRASVLTGSPPLKVRFQNFSTGDLMRYLWDFGDGVTSLEKSPSHTYLTEGQYTVKLNVITSTGQPAMATKTNYITVSEKETISFFYVDSVDNPYSIQTAASMDVEPKLFWFVDQSEGDITERNWIFGDGATYSETNPDTHDVSHIYTLPGDYTVTLLIIYSDGTLERVELPDTLTVL
jgi:PKD repeat protein